jgi:ferredoxin
MISSFQPCMSCRMEVEQEVFSSEGHACHQEQPTLWQWQPPARTQSNLITSQ